MRVLVTLPEPKKQGGVVSYWQALLPRLDGLADSFTVGARVEESGLLRRMLRFLKDYASYYRVLWSQPYDVVHLNPSLTRDALIREGILLLIAKVFGKRVLVFLHGWDAECELSIRRWFLFLFRSVYFKADTFIVLSTRFRSVLEELGYDEQIYVETTVVPDDVFQRPEIKNSRRRLTHDDVNILFLARVERAKGVFISIDAFRRVKDTYPSVTMTIAGDGSDLDKAAKYVKSQGIPDVQFRGWLGSEAKHKVFADADIYLLPTLWGEGCPCSVLEAMSHGLPVVARPVGGLADFLEDGQTGFLSRSQDPHVFAELLCRLIRKSELRREIGTHNRKYAADHFRASQMAHRLERIYASLVG